MSYKTKPTFNRLKIIRGWKNPYLPTKTLNYSRDISLWFKVYILLKSFLNLKKIQLLSCEIRFEQQNKKILYLVINKKKTRRKIRKKKRISFKKLKTPIRKIRNLKSIFFLYQSLIFLKSFSFLNQNAVHKKILSKFWLTKPKISNSMNTFEKILNLRQNSKLGFNFLKKNKIFTPVQQIKLKFYTNKQKRILAQKLRIKKLNFSLYSKLFEALQQQKSKTLLQFIENLNKKIAENQLEIKKINSIYNALSLLNKNAYKRKEKHNLLKGLFLNRIQRKKFTFLIKKLKPAFSSWNRTRFLKQKLPNFWLKVNSTMLPGVYKTNGHFLKKELFLKNILHLNFLIAKIHNKNLSLKNYSLISNFKSELERNISKTNFLLDNFQLKTLLSWNLNRVIKKKQVWDRFSKIYIWFLLRLNEKKKRREKKKRKKYRQIIKFSKTLKKKRRFKLKKDYFTKYILFLSKKKFSKKKNKKLFSKRLKEINKYTKKKKTVRNYQYRLPYRKNYFNFLQLTTQLKLKYLIQDFVQKYFLLRIEAKIVHFLNVYKNQNYFRLVFPIPVWEKKKTKKLSFRKFRQKFWKQKKIFLTSQLQLVTQTKKQNKKPTKASIFTYNIVKSLNKKSSYISGQRKRKNLRIKNNFKRFKGSKDFRHSFKYFIPTLIYFSQTLNPQPLADLLAKVIYKAKKQTWMLNTVKDILKIITLSKNIGFKVALAGRINSSDKSRLIYITRKNVPLQVFDKNMNFAYSQAKARIGVFGIKIWVYF